MNKKRPKQNRITDKRAAMIAVPLSASSLAQQQDRYKFRHGTKQREDGGKSNGRKRKSAIETKKEKK